MPRPLPSSFFDRPTLQVAEDLIGCMLVRTRDGKTERYMITEAEAYDGFDDLASHASKGRTLRTEVMFGPPGRTYIYFVYGIHWMLNVVTGPRDYPSAVLIRGIEGISGPARLTKALGITKDLNNMILSKKTGLWIEEGPAKISYSDIQKTPRIGIDYAGPIWSKKLWRFVLSRKN
jgi:DNA-3-methyladenine glycosylase